MKKYLPIVSSLITVLICIIGQNINQSIEYKSQMTFNGMESLILKIFILFFVGMCVGWNIWTLCGNLKCSTTIIVSILLNILVVCIYFFAFDEVFLYPIALIGIYAFLLLSRLLQRHN